MSSINYARKRVNAILDEIQHLEQSEFPYPHPRDALNILEKLFKDHESLLLKISEESPEPMIHQACTESLHALYVYVPILGFILRSTNVRNAFEGYAPLLRLARNILGTNTKLIVSSEWEFSPFVYRSITDLPDFVLIGLPAPESSNPLLIPLAGHELGHSVWETQKLWSIFFDKIRDGILNLLKTERWEEFSKLYPQYGKKDLERDVWTAYQIWEPASRWALFQTEELFCDFFGLRLFSESYLYAFAYLISPGSSGQRSLQYPNIKRRVSHIIEAAKLLGISIPSKFDTDFIAETEPVEPTTKLLISTADEVSASLISELIELAKKSADSKSVPMRDPEHVKSICNDFALIVPTRIQQPLVDVLNAGWECYLDNNFWTNTTHIRLEDKDRILKDLMLKSIEVSEIYERLRQSK